LNPDEKRSNISKKTEGKTNKNANVEKESPKVNNAASSGKYKGKNAEELEYLKKQFLSKIKDLEKNMNQGIFWMKNMRIPGVHIRATLRKLRRCWKR